MIVFQWPPPARKIVLKIQILKGWTDDLLKCKLLVLYVDQAFVDI